MRTKGTLAAGICILGILAMGGRAYAQYDLGLRPLDAHRVFPLEGAMVPGKGSLFFTPSSGAISVSMFRPFPPMGSDLISYSPAGPRTFREPIDLISPLRLERENGRKMSALTNALGVVSAGAVVYLAYRHVSKYGFLK